MGKSWVRSPKRDDDDEDELDEAEKKRLKTERRLRMIAEERAARIEAEKKADKAAGVAEDGKSGLSVEDVQIAYMLKGLPEPERDQLIATAALVRKSNKDSPATWIPLLRGVQNVDRSQTPEHTSNIVLQTIQAVKELGPRDGGSTRGDVSSLITSISDALKPHQQSEDPVLKAAVTKLINTSIDKMNEPPPASKGFWDDVLEDEDKMVKVRTLFGGGSGSSLDLLKVQREMRESDRRFQIQIIELNNRFALDQSRLGVERGRSKDIKEGVNRMIDAGVKALADEEEDGEGEDKSREKSAGTEVRKKQEDSPVKQIVCDQCQKPMYYAPGQSKSTLTCGNCGAIYKLTEHIEG